MTAKEVKSYKKQFFNSLINPGTSSCNGTSVLSQKYLYCFCHSCGSRNPEKQRLDTASSGM